MTVHNLMEDVVAACMREYMIRHPEIGNLDEGSHSDIRAITLNRLPPKYVSTYKGEMYAKNHLRTQLESDVFRELAYAVEKVTSSKRKTDF